MSFAGSAYKLGEMEVALRRQFSKVAFTMNLHLKVKKIAKVRVQKLNFTSHFGYIKMLKPRLTLDKIYFFHDTYRYTGNPNRNRVKMKRLCIQH